MMNHTGPANVHLASESHQLVTVVGSDPYLIQAHAYMHTVYVHVYSMCTGILYVLYVHVCVLVYMHAIIRG